jgi:hypothetical protein
MGEDIVSGPGAGHRIVGQVWSSQVVDLIRAHSFSDRVGATIMPLHNEITNLPQFLADVAPMWIGEGGAVSADVSPQVSPLVFNAAGAVLDLAPVSRNLVDDAINTGGVNGLVMNSVAMKYARLIDMASFTEWSDRWATRGCARKADCRPSRPCRRCSCWRGPEPRRGRAVYRVACDRRVAGWPAAATSPA